MRWKPGRQRGALLVSVAVLAVIVVGLLVAHGSLRSIFGANRTLYYADDYSYIESDSIVLRTDRRIYNEHEHMIGMLVNLSRYPVEIERKEPTIYQLTSSGWLPPAGITYSMVAYPRAFDEEHIQPGGALSMSMGFFTARTHPENPRWSILEQQFFHNGNEYVVYSNEFVVSEASQPARFRTPPLGIVSKINIHLEVVEPYVVSVRNRSAQPIWFNPLCSDVEVDEHPVYSPYARLQRQSSEGTWQVLHPDQDRCTTVKEPVRIRRGGEAKLFVGDGYPAPHELDPGAYRWHLVLYIDSFPDCPIQRGCFLTGAHLFTETFEP